MALTFKNILQRLMLILGFVWIAFAAVAVAADDLTNLHTRWQRHEITDVEFLVGLKSYWRRSPHHSDRSKFVELVARNESVISLILAQLGSEDFQDQAADILIRVIHHERRPDLMDRILAMIPDASPRVAAGIARALRTGHHLPPRVKAALVGLLAHESLEVQVQAGQELTGHLTEIGPGERRRIYEMWRGAYEAETNRPTVDLEYYAFTNSNGVVNEFLDFLRERSTATISGLPTSSPGSAAAAVARILGGSARSHIAVAEHILDLLDDGATPLPFQKSLLNILGRGPGRFTPSIMERIQDRVLRLMAHPDPEMRAIAVEALGDCELLKPAHPHWSTNQAAVIGLLNDGDLRVREAAVRRLLIQENQAATRALSNALKHLELSPTVRAEIIRSSFVFRGNQDQAQLAQLMRDPHPEVRAAAIDVLHQSGRAALLPLLRSEENALVRLTLLRVLENWNDRPDVLDEIENYFSDPFPEVRQSAINVAFNRTARTPKRLQMLLPALADPNREVRMAAVNAARYLLETPRFRLSANMKLELDRAFMATLEDPDPEMRRVGLNYFKDHAPYSEEFLLALLRRIRDISYPVRLDAVGIIAQHAVYNAELRSAVEALQNELRSDSVDPMALVRHTEADISHYLRYTTDPKHAAQGFSQLQKHLPFHREVHAAFTRALEAGSLDINDEVFSLLLKDSPLRTENTILETLRTVGRNPQILEVLKKLEEFPRLSEETLLEVSRYLGPELPEGRAKNRTPPVGMQLLEIRHAAARVLGVQEDRVITPLTLHAVSDRIQKVSKDFSSRMVEIPTEAGTPRGGYRGEAPTQALFDTASMTEETRKLREKAQDVNRELLAIPLFTGKRATLRARINDRVNRIIARWRPAAEGKTRVRPAAAENIEDMIAAFRAPSRYTFVRHSSSPPPQTDEVAAPPETNSTRVRVVNEDAAPQVALSEDQAELELAECAKESLRAMRGK